MLYSTVMRLRPQPYVVSLVCATLLALAPNVASANSEPPGIHDARHTGTGGLGVAFTEGPAAIFHNPAGLQSVEDFDLTLGFTGLLVSYNAPFGGYGSEQDSPPLFGPLPFLGAAFRVHPRIVVGLSLYISVGFGGRFTNIRTLTDGYAGEGDHNGNGMIDIIGEDLNNDRIFDPGEDINGNGRLDRVEDPNMNGTFEDYYDPFQSPEALNQNVQLFIAELAIPVQVQVTDDLSLGVALRIPYGNFKAVAFQDIIGVWARVEQSVAGVGIPGIYLGGQWRVHPQVTLGFAYRSKVRVGMSGTVFAPEGLGSIERGNPITLNANTDWYVPHMIRAGIAIRLLDDRLMVSFEGRVQFHAEANERLVFRISNRDVEDGGLPGPAFSAAVASGLSNFVSEFQWRNVYIAGLAAEYSITETFRWRFGATWGTIATPPSTTTPFSPPPSNRAWQLATGLGLDLGTHLTVDFGFAIGTNPPAYVRRDHPVNCSNEAIVKGGCNGLYGLTSYFFGLSATYHL